MAKDEITLLTDIAQQLKKLNQTSVRDDLAEREFRDQQLSISAGGVAQEDGGPNFIDAAEDYTRRVKGGITSALVSEKFTMSGERAKIWLQDNKAGKKFKKLSSLQIADKKVGLSTIVNSLQFLTNILGEQRLFWDSLLNQGEKQMNLDNEWRLNDKRSAIEDKREQRKEKVIEQQQPLMLEDMREPQKKGGFLATLAKLWIIARALPILLATAAVTLAIASIKDFVKGWKADGLAGAIGKMLGGSGEGIWNSIKQSFKVGGLGATIGGAIGFLFGGVGAIPGAIIGGLIGMAIGAIAGYFGGDRITAGFKDSAKGVENAMKKVMAFRAKFNRVVERWLYTPGTEARSGHHGAVKAKILGGFISWDPGNFTIGAAWTSAMNSLKSFFTNIGLAIYNPTGNVFFGGTFLEWTAPDWFDGIENAVAAVWTALSDFGGLIKSTLINMLPNWLTDHLGWTVDGKTPSQVADAMRAYNENNPMHPANYDQNFYMKANDGTMKTLEEIDAEKTYLTGAASLAALQSGQQSLYNITDYGKVGSDMWTKLTGIDLRYAAANHIKNKEKMIPNFTDMGMDMGDMSWTAKPNSLQQTNIDRIKPVDERELKSNDSGALVSSSSVVTDASTGKGAVTVIQHLTVDGSASSANIHNINSPIPAGGWMAGLGHNIADLY